jgi:hypothetical protein
LPLPASVIGRLGPTMPAARGAMPAAPPARAGAPRRAGFGSLLAALGGPVVDPPGTSGVVAPVGLPPASLGPDPEDGQAARRRAAAMLEELERLQRGLLAGRIDRACLERLATLATAAAAGEPRLAELAAEIALRARIELARWEAAAPR